MLRLLSLGTGILLLLAAGASCASTRGNVYPLPAGYLRQAELFARLQKLLEITPGLAKLHVIGFSGTENLPLYALEIGRKEASRAALIIGQHHGDEVLGLELSLAWAETLLRGSGSDKQIREILRQWRFWIVPTVNPEAWRVVSAGLLRNKRKNNRDTDGNGVLDLHTDGVDLNRNYPVFWDADLDLPTTHPNYKGSAPASEPEIQAVLALAQRQAFDLAIFYHSSASGAYSEKIFLPALRHGELGLRQKHSALRELALLYASQLKRDYQKGTYEVGSQPGSRVGNARNYFFHLQGTDAFLVELGGINSDGISVIHPPASRRDKILTRHVRALTRLFHSTLQD